MDDDYDNALNREGRNLSQLTREGKLAMPRFRDAEIKNIVDALAQGRSVLLLGEAGVGKTGGRQAMLKPVEFHQLPCERADLTAGIEE